MKKNIVISIMTIALSTALLAGCGQQNVEPTQTNAPETEVTTQVEEPTEVEVEEPEVIEEPVVEEPEIVEEPETDIPERPEIVAQGLVSSGPLMDYEDVLGAFSDGTWHPLVTFEGDAIKARTFGFDLNPATENVDFNGLTAENTPEEYLYKCVELFGMPAVYDDNLTNCDYIAQWYFDAPNTVMIDGFEAKYVSLVLTGNPTDETYALKMHIFQDNSVNF